MTDLARSFSIRSSGAAVVQTAFMQLNPRYGGDPLLVLDGDPSAICAPTVRQRRRFAAVAATFSTEDWLAPSRCAGWSNRDVIVHLDGTNRFWGASISAGVRGEPTCFLSTFDPVATPAAMVGGDRAPAEEVLARFSASVEELASLLESLSAADWTKTAEAPGGHISVSAVAHHALWDSWVHERDVLVPLGRSTTHDAVEIAACLRYAAGLSPALGLTQNDQRTGALPVRVTNPDVEFTVEVSDAVRVVIGCADAVECVSGDAVELLEAFSVRVPFPDGSIPSDLVWLTSGLVKQFDG